MNPQKLPLVGISVGDYIGVGMEVVLKTFTAQSPLFSMVTPVVFADILIGTHYKNLCGINAFLHPIKHIADAKKNSINFLPPSEKSPIIFDTVSKASGLYAYQSLEATARALTDEKIAYMVTAPIDKSNIQSEKFNFSGHTEYLESQFEGISLMILCSGQLRVGLVTGHIPISAVAKEVTSEKITEKARLMYHALKKDFGLKNPRLAILGLNPHCGDKGVIGTEDDTVVNPTITALKKEMNVDGAFPADGFFGSGRYKNFDGILAMYHDQGLAPFKALSFGKGVNFTAGLSRIRTSPDHGTAFDIAGKGIADATSFKEAVLQGLQIYQNCKDKPMCLSKKQINDA